MQIINIKIKELKVYEKNARVHPKKQADLFLGSGSTLIASEKTGALV